MPASHSCRVVSHAAAPFAQVSLPTQYNGKNQEPVGALSSALARLQVRLRGGAGVGGSCRLQIKASDMHVVVLLHATAVQQPCGIGSSRACMDRPAFCRETFLEKGPV